MLKVKSSRNTKSSLNIPSVFVKITWGGDDSAWSINEKYEQKDQM